MKVAIPAAPRRLIFLAREEQRIHLPVSNSAERFFALDGEGRASSLARASSSGAEISFILDPAAVSLEEIARLPGIKIGIATALPEGDEAIAALHARARGAANAGGINFYTWPETSRPEQKRAHLEDSAPLALPILHTLPLPLDLARLPDKPRAQSRSILIPEWAQPPPAVLARLREIAELEHLLLNADIETTLAALQKSSTVLYWDSSRDPLSRLRSSDRLPWLALGCGQLLISNRAFDPGLGLEQEDEYLVRLEEESFAREAERSLDQPAAAQPVRVRAFQKIREAFAAGPAFEKLAHDALWFEGRFG